MSAPPAATAKPNAMPGGSADRMGNMNPERLQRLRRSPSNEELVYQRMDGSPLPRKSSAKGETQGPAPIPAPAAAAATAAAAAATVSASMPAPALAANPGSRVKFAQPLNGKGQKTGAARPNAAGPRPPAGKGRTVGRVPAASAAAGAGGNVSGNAGPGNAQPVTVRAQQLPAAIKQERVVLPPISVMTGIQRPSSQVEEDGEKSNAVTANGLRCRPIVQHGGAQPYEINADTRYLEGMLGYHRFRLTVQPWAGKVGSMSYSRIVTHAGLLLHGFLRSSTSIPVLPLPAVASTSAGGEPVVVEGAFDQTIRGQVLEEVWSSLTPTVKFSIARQLRRIVTAMRAAGADLAPAQRLLGSARSGAWSIIMDRHRTKTYWAIQEGPTHYSFVSFLQATFDPGVPRTISNALFRQLNGEHAEHAGYATVLAHGEIAPRSIVIDGARVVAVLGWNCSGWYPEWWDYAKFFETGTRAANRDWYDYASEIFDREYPAELAAYQGFVRCQKP